MRKFTTLGVCLAVGGLFLLTMQTFAPSSTFDDSPAASEQAANSDSPTDCVSTASASQCRQQSHSCGSRCAADATECASNATLNPVERTSSCCEAGLEPAPPADASDAVVQAEFRPLLLPPNPFQTAAFAAPACGNNPFVTDADGVVQTAAANIECEAVCEKSACESACKASPGPCCADVRTSACKASCKTACGKSADCVLECTEIDVCLPPSPDGESKCSIQAQGGVRIICNGSDSEVEADVCTIKTPERTIHVDAQGVCRIKSADSSCKCCKDGECKCCGNCTCKSDDEGVAFVNGRCPFCAAHGWPHAAVGTSGVCPPGLPPNAYTQWLAPPAFVHQPAPGWRPSVHIVDHHAVPVPWTEIGPHHVLPSPPLYHTPQLAPPRPRHVRPEPHRGPEVREVHLKKAAEHLEAAGLPAQAAGVRKELKRIELANCRKALSQKQAEVREIERRIAKLARDESRDRQVTLEMTILEVPRQSLIESDFKCPRVDDALLTASYTNGKKHDPPGSNFSRCDDAVPAFVERLLKDDRTKVLSRPMVITTVGRPARVQSGRVVVPESAPGEPGLEPIFFGFNIQAVVERVDEDGATLQLAPEVSKESQEDAVTIGAGIRIPGRTVRRFQTRVRVPTGRTVVVAGPSCASHSSDDIVLVVVCRPEVTGNESRSYPSPAYAPPAGCRDNDADESYGGDSCESGAYPSPARKLRAIGRVLQPSREVDADFEFPACCPNLGEWIHSLWSPRSWKPETETETIEVPTPYGLPLRTKRVRKVPPAALFFDQLVPDQAESTESKLSDPQAVFQPQAG